MRAIVQERYGPPRALRLREIEPPRLADDEVLVRVRAASVHPDVWHVVHGRPYVLRLMGSGVRRPKDRVPGTDAAGIVQATGRTVTRFRVGDEVFGESLRGMQWRNGGAYAELVAMPEEAVAHKPEGVAFEEAACVPTAGLIALQNLRSLPGLAPGARVLVNGGAGGVGAIALQTAKTHGLHVTAVDHTRKLALLRKLGADEVLDYTVVDFTRSAQRYDLVFDIHGNHAFSDVRRVLSPAGKYVLIGHDGYGHTGHRVLGSIPRMLGLMLMARFVDQLPASDFSSPDRTGAMARLADLLGSGQLTPVVDRTFPLDQVPAAIDYLASGRACGRVVVTV